MTQKNEVSLAKIIIQLEEGFRSKPYYCTKGFPTIGWGHVLGPKGSPLPNIVWTKEQGLKHLEIHLATAIKELTSHKSIKDIYNSLNADRRAIVISMWYQLGIGKLADFKNTLKAMASARFDVAAKQMLDSDVARECANRWHRQAEVMRTGSVTTSYKI